MNPFSKELPLYLKITCTLISVMIVGYLSVLGKEIFSPLLFASLLAILLLPVANFLEKKCRLPRGVASILTVLFFLVTIAFLFYVLGGQLHALAREWPQFKEQLGASLKVVQAWVSETAHINLEEQVVYFNNATSRFFASGTTMIGSTLLSISSIVFFVLITFIYAIFFLRYRSLIMRFFTGVFGERNINLVHEIAERVQTIIRQYIVGLLLEMFTVSAILCIAFSMMGIRYAILLGLLGGVFNLIPYIGIFITLVISALITFATAAAAGKVFLVIIVLVSTHLVDANLIFPWIVGSKVRINPMVMIAGVVIGGLVWGVSGMFLSIPVIAVLKIIFDRIDTLKPWGLLLGSDERAPITSRRRVLKKRKI